MSNVIYYDFRKKKEPQERPTKTYKVGGVIVKGVGSDQATFFMTENRTEHLCKDVAFHPKFSPRLYSAQS